jgi:hypothetical protein
MPAVVRARRWTFRCADAGGGSRTPLDFPLADAGGRLCSLLNSAAPMRPIDRARSKCNRPGKTSSAIPFSNPSVARKPRAFPRPAIHRPQQTTIPCKWE